MSAAYKRPTRSSSRSGDYVLNAGGAYVLANAKAVREVLRWPFSMGASPRTTDPFVTYLRRPPAVALSTDAASGKAGVLRDATGPSSGWAKIDRDIDAWARMGPDWDGEGAEPLAREVVASARSLAGRLAELGAPVPEHYVAGDGEIGFRWKSDAGFASASLLPDLHVVLYLHKGDEVLHEIDVPWRSDFDVKAFARDLASIG